MKQITLAAMALVALTVTGCVNRDEQKTAKETAKIVSDPLIAVSVQSAQTRPLSESVEVTGSIDVGDTTAVGARISGRIVSVFVQEGSVVKEGQILAVQDTSQLQTQLSQALANLRSAEAQLQQQIKNASMTPDRTSAQIRTAEAALRQARVNLQKAINGPRGQEIEQAEATLRSADENLKTQKLELERVQKLVSEGAVAANRLDSQRNQVAAAQAQFDGAKQSVNLLREGTRKEDIQALREAVSQAESSVRSSKVQRDLDSLLLDQVRSSKAQVDAARASVQQIQGNPVALGASACG
jgi:HlyD family secretion protein